MAFLKATYKAKIHFVITFPTPNNYTEKLAKEVKAAAAMFTEILINLTHMEPVEQEMRHVLGRQFKVGVRLHVGEEEEE
jgi:hypothetical protein